MIYLNGLHLYLNIKTVGFRNFTQKDTYGIHIGWFRIEYYN